ncbi:hypothetical protein CANARDRAFT_193738 [[Candida] arabinofermentans NRRL YB-2248]|uniref:FHA domain-containing protein n=1 Tax=[Candida] arabinofermentans NRRL YB-2248 TaxID=983967 RepID=A0A1E4T8L5_9ASCO|nr:hypothetical protein CANARDRAFT_193738 [[Candida] arabinofermentans NRRL YB-2248]
MNTHRDGRVSRSNYRSHDDDGGRAKNYHDNKKSDRSRSPTVKPIPVVMKPSGYLNIMKSISLEPTLYKPPNDEFKPTFQTKPKYYLYKFEIDPVTNDVLKEVKIPLIDHIRSYYLIGRDEKLCDIIINDSLISKEHAVIQFRSKVDKSGKLVNKAYLMDLSSTNGSFLNDDDFEIPRKRYVELLNKDRLKFGEPLNIKNGDCNFEFVFIIDE